MIIDLPPHIEQVIMATAEKRGLTLGEMFAQDYAKLVSDELMADQLGVYADLDKKWVLNEQQSEQLLDLLENPPPKTEAMKQLLALRERYV